MIETSLEFEFPRGLLSYEECIIKTDELFNNVLTNLPQTEKIAKLLCIDCNIFLGMMKRFLTKYIYQNSDSAIAKFHFNV